MNRNERILKVIIFVTILAFSELQFSCKAPLPFGKLEKEVQERYSHFKRFLL